MDLYGPYKFGSFNIILILDSLINLVGKHVLFTYVSNLNLMLVTKARPRING